MLLGDPSDNPNIYLRCGQKRLHNYSTKTSTERNAELVVLNSELVRCIDEGVELRRQLSVKMGLIADMLETLRLTAAALNFHMEISN